MSWIVTNGKEGKGIEYVQIKAGGFYWTKRRDSAIKLADEVSAKKVARGMIVKAYPKPVSDSVVDQLLNVGA